MPANSITSVLSALGIDREAEQLYFRLRPASGHTLEGVASMLRMELDDIVTGANPLAALGLVVIADGRLTVPPPEQVVATLVHQESAISRASGRRLDQLAAAVPHLVAASARPSPDDMGEVHPLDGELSSGGNPLALLKDLVSTSRGDMLWLRPDAWQMPRESAVTTMLSEAMAGGRRSRAIYPARALREAPDALRARAQLGEQVRVISDLSTRMFILGDSHAVLPEPLGFTDEPRVHVRQRSIVAALTMWFEALWDQASPVPEMDFGEARPDLRRFLLEQLAEGATDEQIAPKLGISLRTVRRRVAGLMIELGADTRFQAGVEAVRRGWI